MIRRVLILAATVALSLAWCAGAQAAQTISFESCSHAVKDAGGWTEYGGAVGVHTEDDCAFENGLQIFDQWAEEDDYAGWSLNLPGVDLVSFSFDVDGGDTTTGMSYGATSCIGCSVEQDIGPRTALSPTDHIEVTSPQGNEPTIVGTCTMSPGCDTTDSPLRISNIVVVVTDSSPPTVSGLVNGAVADGDGFLGWTNKDYVSAGITAQDDGFGVFKGHVEIVGAAAAEGDWNFIGDCFIGETTSLIYLCPPVANAETLVDISDLVDGHQDVIFSAEDSVGNVASSDTAQLGIDRQAPAPPESTVLDFVHTGWPGQRWTSNPAVSLSWPEAPDVDDPEVDSPLTGTEFSTHKHGAAVTTRTLQPSDATSTSLSLSAEGEWDLAARYLDAAGNRGDQATATVGLDTDAPNPVGDLDDSGWISDADLADGRRVTWSAPAPKDSLESGVCGYVVRVDQSLSSSPLFGNDDSTTGTSWPIPAGLPDGDNFIHVSAVSCAGVQSATTTALLRLDTTPPTISVTDINDPGEWSRVSQSANLLSADPSSGVDAIGYALDDGPTTWVSDDHTSVPLPTGQHKLTVKAIDKAGNSSTAQNFTVLTDIAAPQADFDTPSTADPTLVTAHVSDIDSGLSSASMEIRRVDSGADDAQRAWQPLGAPEPVTRGTTTPVALQRRIDDAKLDSGDYEIRIDANDVAGNASAGGDFAIRGLHLPLRRQAELSAGVADVLRRCRTAAGRACKSVSKCHKKSRCRMVEVIDREHPRSSVVRSWKDKSVLVGDALDANGAPLAGARVVITTTPASHESSPLGEATTDSAGHYEFSLPPGPTRVITAQIEGGPTQQPAKTSATIAVRADVRFNPIPRTVRSGGIVELSGRVLHPEWLPVGGVTVNFQWLSSNGWAVFAVPVQTQPDGKFTFSYPWSNVKRAGTVRLRAQVAGQGAWPFAPGSSDAVRIHALPAR
jgi:hypothetical protein